MSVPNFRHRRGLGSVLTRAVGYKAILLCCVLLFISFCMMFVPEKDM